MVKVLLTGGSGLLGKYLMRSKPINVELSATYHMNAIHMPGIDMYALDVQNKAMVSLLANRIQPDIIIHAAAVGSVDYCEQSYAPAYAINVVGTEHMVNVANAVGAKLVYISSNAVYSGDNPPYKEGHNRRAVNRYGNMKIMAEDYVMLNSKNYAIIRPILLYGWPFQGGRDNWAVTVVKKLRTGFPLKVVDDTVTQPTYAGDVAQAIWHILKTPMRNGEFNVADNYYKGSLYDFTVNVADVFSLDKSLIEPVSSSHFQGLAERPVDTTYDTNRLQKTGFTIKSNRLYTMMGEVEHEPSFSSHVY